MIYIYTYLLICCITYFQVYQQILYRFDSFDYFVEQVRKLLKYEYGKDVVDPISDQQIKIGLYVVVFLTSPFLLVTGVFK